MRYLAASLICALVCSCATSYSRFNPQVIAVTAHMGTNLCTSQDERFVAYRQGRGGTVVAEAKTGVELWRDAGTIAYCGASGVVFADKASLAQDPAPGAPEEQKVGIRVAVRDYRSGRPVLQQVVTIRSCSENRFSFRPWPRGAWVGLEWEGSLHWGAAYPPGDRFERLAERCSGSGGLWVHKQTREVTTMRDGRREHSPSRAASLEKIRRLSNARRLVVAIETTPVKGKTDGCGAPLHKLTLVARWDKKATWRKPFGFSSTDCRP